ncbi:MAG TPA: pitrilysin family protein [Bryobacteraceae bacterium]|nr:pitrilysin family protein [Bryobacteraceae bacterium]
MRIAGKLWMVLVVLAGTGFGQGKPGPDVTRATLPNGLRVVIVRDSFAPVVTVEENYLAGANETPPGFPGMAHAQEHMAFRGCAGVSADQIAAIYARLGGSNNADTQQNVTQYFATVPNEDLDVALRLDAACMQGVDDAAQQWSEERGAIEQEVARDLSNPTYKFLTRLNEDLFAGTPYAHDALGTKPSFDATTAAMLHKFYETWYAPNNAILVISGNVDPQAALSDVRKIYGNIPRRPVPAPPEIKLQPVKSETFTLESDLPYKLVFLAYRLPGTDSSDYAAARVMADVLGSERAKLYDLSVQGKALGTDFGVADSYRHASVAFAAAAIPPTADGTPMIAEIRKIVAGYTANGLPAELVEAAKRREVAAAEFRRNSIPGLASSWSEALAIEGKISPDDDVAAIRKVSVADVNRVAKAFLVDQNGIAAMLNPAPSGKPVPSKGFGGAETLTSAPGKPVALPAWAEVALKTLAVPQSAIHPQQTTLPNGLRLIVQTETITPTITVLGAIRNEPDLETSPGKEGVSEVLDGLFSYGTTTLDRLAFRKALDDIAAGESAGASFTLRVLKPYFSRGLQLLADNELHPALPASAFSVVRQQTAQAVAGQLQSPGYKTSRALDTALLPKNDPDLREATPATVTGLTLDDVRAYYQKVFRPDLATIVVIGDVTLPEARAEIEKYFGSWTAAGAKPEVTLPPVPPNQAASFNVPDPQRIQDQAYLAEELPMNRFNPDYYALQLGNHVLGGGFYATRLYHDLRQVNGYVYNVDDSLNSTRSRSVYTVAFASDPQNVSKARALIERDLSQMQTEDVSPGELEQAKAILLRQIPLSESSEGQVAGRLLALAQTGLPLDEPQTAAARYLALTAGQVRAAFAKWIRPKDFVQVVEGPPPR